MQMLLERDRELAVIGDAVRQAGGGEGTVLLIEGPIGVGKTALLRAVQSAASHRGLRVLWARGGEVERGLGWGIVRDLLLPVLGPLSGPERQKLLSGAAGAAGQVLGLAGAPGLLSSQESQSVALHGLYWLLAALTQTGGAVLAVDDVHLGDEPSLAWLSYLATRLEGLPVLLAATIREGDPGASAARDALTDSSARQLRLRPAPLSQAGTAALTEAVLARGPDPGLSQACFQATGGNPLLLGHLTRAIKEEGREALESGASSPFDVSAVTRSVLVRIGRLAPEASALAVGAAVLGSSCRVSEICALMELDQARAVPAADALTAAGIFSAPGEIEFTHPIVRAGIYEDISPHRRSQLHLRASRVPGRGPEFAAAQLLAVEPGSDPEVVHGLVEGAEAAMARGAAAAAVLYLRRALREHGAGVSRAELHHRLGTAAVRAGHFEEGFRALGQAFELAEQPRAKAQVAIELGSHLAVLGTGRGVPLLRRALNELRPDPEAFAEVEAVYLDFAILWADHFKGALARLRELYGRSGSKTEHPGRLAALAAGTMLAADEPASLVIDLACRSVRHGVLDHPTINHAAFIGMVLAHAEAFDEAEALWSEAIHRAGESRGPLRYGIALGCRSLSFQRRGDIPMAEADARSSIDLLRQHGAFQSDVYVHLADALIERDRCQDALELFDSMPALPEAMATGWQGLYNRAGRGRILQSVGDHTGALAEFEACLTSEFGRNPAVLKVGLSAALSRHALGQSEHARALAERDLEAARRFGAPGTLGVALRTLGTVAGGQAGIELLRGAETVLSGSRARLEHARGLLELGAALRRAGYRAEARQKLSFAYQSARECGGLRVARQAREELRVAGARPRRDELRGRDALTASEYRVVRMAAEGRSNAEIAQQLFVTLRTVETHLTHAYQKLGVTGRGQLAGALGSGSSAA